MALLGEQLYEVPTPAPGASHQETIAKIEQARFRLWQGMQYGLPNKSNWWQRYRERELTSGEIDYVPEGVSSFNGHRLRIWLGRTAGREIVSLNSQVIKRTSIGTSSPLYGKVGESVVRAQTRGPEVFINIAGYGLVSPLQFSQLVTSPNQQLAIIEEHADTVDHLAHELNLPEPSAELLAAGYPVQMTPNTSS